MSVTVKLGEREHKVLPLNLAGMRKLATSGALRDLDGFDTAGLALEEKHINAVTTVVHVVLSRGSPDLTREEVEDALDVTNMPALLPRVLEGAGLVRRASGEGQGSKS